MPFQSHRWYAFGERVMSDCQPFYVLAYEGSRLEAILRRYPLLVCRSPLSNTSGLLLPPSPLRDEALHAIGRQALHIGKQAQSLALMFDFLSKPESENWQNGFVSIKMQNPGTVMQSRWRSLDEYLQEGGKKDRQHYKRTLREIVVISVETLTGLLHDAGFEDVRITPWWRVFDRVFARDAGG